jgi:hypothetical protein
MSPTIHRREAEKMKMAGFTYFPFDVVDWMTSKDVMAMTAAERGVYITLLCVQYRDGFVPADLKACAKASGLDIRLVTRWFPKWSHLFPTSQLNGDHLVNEKLHEIAIAVGKLTLSEGAKERKVKEIKEEDEVVSQSVSESVKAAALLPSNLDENLYGLLSERARAILDLIYPRHNPEYASVAKLLPELEEVSGAFTVENWKAFFRWNKTHKPAPLVYRSLEKFLAGIVYSLNDYTDHDPAKCPRCKKLGSVEVIAPCTECGGEGGSSDRFGMCSPCWDAANDADKQTVQEQKHAGAIARDRERNPGSYPNKETQ